MSKQVNLFPPHHHHVQYKPKANKSNEDEVATREV